jgi:hypothetical protein
MTIRCFLLLLSLRKAAKGQKNVKNVGTLSLLADLVLVLKCRALYEYKRSFFPLQTSRLFSFLLFESIISFLRIYNFFSSISIFLGYLGPEKEKRPCLRKRSENADRTFRLLFLRTFCCNLSLVTGVFCLALFVP